MSIWKKLRRKAKKQVQVVAEEKMKHLRELALTEVVDPYDLVFFCDLALEIAVSHALKMDLDPQKYVLEMLESIGVVFTEKWALMVRAAIVQYNMGLFVKRLNGLNHRDFNQSVRMTGVTYSHCIKQSIDEANDELRQINGLLDEMPGRDRNGSS